MARILSIETALDTCSVAIHENGALVLFLETRTPRSHAAQLAPLIQEVCTRTGSNLKQLSAIAVSAGPGSYTGLRIGAATAKGLCYALGTPLIAVNTLDVIAHQARPLCQSQSWICALIDARRMDVFYKVFDPLQRQVVPATAATLSEALFQPLLNPRQPICFAGNGAAKCQAIVQLQYPQAQFIPHIYPSATALGQLAFLEWQAGNVADAETFEPHYTKEFYTTLPR
jgi:tRNA threonylcarbamoyladenosine biosynthesis protein TsaB